MIPFGRFFGYELDYVLMKIVLLLSEISLPTNLIQIIYVTLSQMNFGRIANEGLAFRNYIKYFSYAKRLNRVPQKMIDFCSED